MKALVSQKIEAQRARDDASYLKGVKTLEGSGTRMCLFLTLILQRDRPGQHQKKPKAVMDGCHLQCLDSQRQIKRGYTFSFTVHTLKHNVSCKETRRMADESTRINFVTKTYPRVLFPTIAGSMAVVILFGAMEQNSKRCVAFRRSLVDRSKVVKQIETVP